MYDEISQFIEGRYLSPMKAAWCIQELPLCGRSLAGVRLAVYTENLETIVFEENKETEALSK